MDLSAATWWWLAAGALVLGELAVGSFYMLMLALGCVAGALDEDDYRHKLAAAGFSDIGVEPTRIYTAEDAREFLSANGLDTSVVSDEMDGKFLSAFIRAVKPAH